MISKEPHIDWKVMSEKLNALRKKLEGLRGVRKKLTSLYPTLLKDTKAINKERKQAIIEKQVKQKRIHELAKKYNEVKLAWIEKFSEDTLYMNVHAQKLAKRFQEAQEDKEEVILRRPARFEKLYNERAYETKKVLRQIRAVSSQYKSVQREIDSLQTIYFVLDWQKIDATHYFDEYCEIDIYQASIKKRKLYHRHNYMLCKINGKWFYIVDGDAGDPVEDHISAAIDKQLTDRTNATNLYGSRN